MYLARLLYNLLCDIDENNTYSVVDIYRHIENKQFYRFVHSIVTNNTLTDKQLKMLNRIIKLYDS